MKCSSGHYPLSEIKIYIRLAETYIKMFDSSSRLNKDPPRDPTLILLEELKNTVLHVKRVRKWFLVNPLTKAFIKACMMVKIVKVKSILLMKVIIKTIRELKQIVSKEYRLVEAGIQEAWKLSKLASSWGHEKASEWRNNRSYIILQALTLQWLARLFGGVMKIM